ncbi:hypothetical protein Tsubulata_050401 [Turnera subulata]|uniref:Beta-glucosidase n=1 Tax=Turnera subulata TaxID=218843 RepID=A0A9Q0FTL1_9ROSI|nr:hypothetical protein Tsubulata_050401 [Turnera subulata]
MGTHQGFGFVPFIFMVFVSVMVVSVSGDNMMPIKSPSQLVNRCNFPKGFVFGTATAAYQIEGAAKEGGRGPSVWDTFTEKYPDKIKDHSSGAVADDSYHRYKEDVALLKDYGFDAYRFSISWSRLLPTGRVEGGVNQEGINYYNNVINELIANGIQPFVTLYHWDAPQALEDEYLSFLSPKIADDFAKYADLCFKTYGDRVKKWITLNEPLTIAANSYGSGGFAPGRCSKHVNPNCTGGDSSTEPYISAHNMILAHAAAVKVYREKYQASQKGEIGITLNSNWFISMTDSLADRLAVARALAFNYDWFMEPLNFGTYPADMVKNVGSRLPQFTQEQAAMVKGSFDFIGLNHYTSNYIADAECNKKDPPTYFSDSCVNGSFARNGVNIGPTTVSSWLYIYPKGIEDLLLYTKYKYNDPVIYITENGVGEPNTGSVSLEDKQRVDYYSRYLLFVRRAIKIGANIKGYFAWSLLDNFEWADGYSIRFGITFVDYKDGMKRYPKNSAKMFKEMLACGSESRGQQQQSTDSKKNPDNTKEL